jgi:hypothetical protein
MTEKEIIDLADDILQEYTGCYNQEDLDYLVEMLRKKIPEDAVVLTEGEYSDLLFDEVATLKRDIAEYWANADFENVVKELHKNGYRKLDDHAIFVLRKAKGLEEKVRKETAREIFSEVLDLEGVKLIRDMGWEKAYEIIYNEMIEIAKRFGVEVG